ncbi:MAG: hypothetical protein IH845_00825 [Nanoarchaeota archaeon]|nr:hypothetical protein [Nanoarchaeota archaeon]
MDPDGGGSTAYEGISIYVNWTEDSVSLGSIADVTLYENYTFYVSGTDDDLLIQDFSVRDENLTFASNTSFVSVTQQGLGSFQNFINLTVDINWDNISSEGDANYSVLINVTDVNGSVDSKVFTVEILSDVAAEWNESKIYINVSNEGDEVYINLSEYVNDNDTLTFSYTNDSRFDNFSLTSAGIVNFTSSDVDVGYHNITFNAYDGKLNSYHIFNFTIYNVDDNPSISSLTPAGSSVSPPGSISEGDSISTAEDDEVNFTILLNDDDFLIPSGQKSQFYDESLSINVNATNSTGGVVDLFNFSFVSSGPDPNQVQYKANFTPDFTQIENYTIVLNITDVLGLSVTRTFGFNISSVNDAPNLTSFSNQTQTINDTFYLDINATDQEDGNDTLGVINFTLSNLTVGGDFLSINITTGVINFSLNETYVGIWEYNVSVNDTGGAVDYQIFRLTVYGYPNITDPMADNVFNWVENVATGDLYFNVSYGVNDTLLTYKIYIDRIVYSTNSSFNYTDLINDSSLRNNTNFTLHTGNNFTWNFTPNFTDETYSLYKNITLVVFNPTYPEFNTSLNWKVNISHTNAPMRQISGAGIGILQADYNSNINLVMSKYFVDEDVDDPFYNQNTTFSKSDGHSDIFLSHSNDWDVSIFTNINSAFSGFISIFGSDGSTNDTIENIEVVFIEPTTTPAPVSSGGGGGKTKIKHFSLKLIVPDNIIISDQNFIEIPFKIQNNGQVDFRGINLTSYVQFNNEFTEDVSISLGEDYIEELKFGQSENFTLRINANTQRSGRYKATIYANVTSPKFSDFGDFFIELRKTNESVAEQLLIFTQKFLSANPECIELTELLREARSLFDIEDFSGSARIAREVTEACEDSISSNEQISFSAGAIVEENLYYLSFMMLTLFLGGIIFYIYKRVRFNKSKIEDYI